MIGKNAATLLSYVSDGGKAMLQPMLDRMEAQTETIPIRVASDKK
jgi:hypothetical protein